MVTKEHTARQHLQWQRDNPERQAEFQRNSHRKLRQEVLNAYGGKCACCGETQYEFLAIDHIDGNGAAHRRENKLAKGTAFYYWLRREDWPEGFQVLCHNCNQAKGWYGQCPHSQT